MVRGMMALKMMIIIGETTPRDFTKVFTAFELNTKELMH
jgi:hypothetical protein